MAPTILQIIPELNTGGAEKTVLEITEALQTIGWKSLVVSQGGVLAGPIERAGGRFIEMAVKSKNPFVMRANSARLVALIRAEHINLVHARSRAPAWSALWACRKTSTPFVTTYHGAHSQGNALKRTYNSVMARGDVVIANSDYTAEQILKYHGACVKKLETIYRGVDMDKTDLAQISSERRDALRQKWGLQKNDVVILQPARLSSRKGQRDVIGAMSFLKETHLQNSQKGNNFVVIMAGGIEGNEAYHRVLQEDIEAAGLGDQIKCVGYCDDMPAAFAISDLVLAVSSKPESFGRVVAESMAMGLPVIVSDVGAQPEIIKDDMGANLQGTYCVGAHQPEAIAKGILALSNLSADERAAYGALARAHVEGKYTAKGMKAQTIEVYKGLLGGSGATVGG